MPKLTNISKEKILDITEKILKTEGYHKVSIRGLATECNVAIGTIYLYFPSKDNLIAHVIMRDWQKCLSDLDNYSLNASDFLSGISYFYEKIIAFFRSYEFVFNQYSETNGSFKELRSRHELLRKQISQCLMKLAYNTNQPHIIDSIDMVSECLLVVVNQKDMDEINLVKFLKLLVK